MMRIKPAFQTSMFEKVLRAFGTGDLPYTYVQSELKRLLDTGESPQKLLDVMQRRELIEPLPEKAHEEVLRILNEAIERAAAPNPPPDPAPSSSAIAAVGQTATPLPVPPPGGAETEPTSSPADGAPSLVELYASLKSDFESLARSFEDAQDRGTTATARAVSLGADLAAARTALAVEQNKSREMGKTLAEKSTLNDAARSRSEAALRQSEQSQGDLRQLRDMLAARDQTLAQARQALAEREAELATLKQEHARTVTELEARAKNVEADMRTMRTQADTVASSYVELLQNREWRQGFDQNRSRELDARDETVTMLEMRESKQAAQILESAPLARREPWKPSAMVRTIGIGLATVILAILAWSYVHRWSAAAKAPTVLAALPAAGAVIRDCPTCPALTVLRAGRFQQGSEAVADGSAPFEKPLHWVAIGKAFAMSTNDVTVDEFRAFISMTGRDMRGCETYDGEWRPKPENNWENPGFVQTGSHPVTCASWEDAQAYAGWLSAKTGHRYRLPSASEWEYAARAGGAAAQPWDSSVAGGACANANVADASAAREFPGWTVFSCDDGYINTAPVGSFKTNAFGLNDMLGNVFQWTEDCWHADYSGAPVDGRARTDGDCSQRELRGGSWFSTPAYVRANYRNHFAANYRTSSVGIRLVRDLAS
jgi:formylglycine-generating enzyme required for sulfatase activity